MTPDLLASLEPVTCPKCGRENMRLNRTHQRTDGLIALQYRCRNHQCLKNQTITIGEKTGKLIYSGYQYRKLTDSQVRTILVSSKSSASLARSFNVSRQTIADVRKNRRYQDVHPELEREDDLPLKKMAGSCKPCVHWLNDACSLDFPEGKSGAYAPMCACFFADANQGIANALSMVYH